MRLRRKEMAEIKEIACERIEKLFSLADEVFKQRPDLAQRYVDLARKIAMKCQVRLDVKYRRRICHRCKSFLVFGVNARVRVKDRRGPHVAITCLKCRNIMRIPIRGKREK